MLDLYKQIKEKISCGKKLLAALIDPDKCDSKNYPLKEKVKLFCQSADFIFVGGSLITTGNFENTVQTIKKHATKPVIIFPGDNKQISSQADAILLLTLISGRNPDMLIGKHVEAAFQLKKSGIEIIPTGYLLIDSGRITTALYMSGTQPIPRHKHDVASATALAGEQLGLKMIYADAGSNAEFKIPVQMIKAIKNEISVPLIIGGGLRSGDDILDAWNAGADIVVVGNALEKEPELINSFSFKNKYKI